MKRRGKNISIFIDCSILYNRCFAFSSLLCMFESDIQKVDLEMKSPTLHVLIEISKERVVFCIVKMSKPIIVFSEFGCKDSLSGTYVPRNSYVMHNLVL